MILVFRPHTHLSRAQRKVRKGSMLHPALSPPLLPTKMPCASHGQQSSHCLDRKGAGLQGKLGTMQGATTGKSLVRQPVNKEVKPLSPPAILLLDAQELGTEHGGALGEQMFLALNLPLRERQEFHHVLDMK